MIEHHFCFEDVEELVRQRDEAAQLLKEAFPWLEAMEEKFWSRELHDLIGRVTRFLVSLDAEEVAE